MNLNWREFMVSLPVFEKWLKDTLGELYLGYIVNGSGYIIALDDSVSQIQKDTIKAKWDSLTPDSEEVVSYRSRDWFKNRTKQIETEALAKSMADWSSLERKVMLKLEVSPLELLGME